MGWYQCTRPLCWIWQNGRAPSTRTYERVRISGSNGIYVFACVGVFLVGGTPQLQTVLPRKQAPFEKYPARDVLPTVSAKPQIHSEDERQVRTVLQDAVIHGWGVVDGETEHERQGVNFDGHYLLVQWGCGSNCMRASLIDGHDGKVLKLPQVEGEKQTGFGLPTGTSDLRTIEFRWNSALLGIPRVADGEIYYYRLIGRKWKFVCKVPTPPDHN